MNRKRKHKVHVVASVDKTTRAMVDEVVKSDRRYRNKSDMVENAIRQFYHRWKGKKLIPVLDALHNL